MSKITSLARIWLTRSFRPFHFSNKYDQTLSYKETEHLGLYVHIPFCRTICSFCPYCKVVYEKELADKYLKSLLDEIELTGNMESKKKTVTSLYFGGGSPGLLAKEISTIISKIKEYFTITEGIGVELHPLDVRVETLKMLKEAGITKISIGIQSFQEEYLGFLGRKELHQEEMFEALEEVPFDTVSMDFIFALPGQTMERVKRDMELAFKNHANHIAIYPFIDFSYTSRSFSPMGNKEKKKLLYSIVSYCEEMGYVRDSIWTFSKKGVAGYSSMTRDNFLGFGCSATTLLKEQFKINTFDIKEYIKRIDSKDLPTSLTIKFTQRQRMVYYLFWTLYSMELDEEEFFRFFNRRLNRYFGAELLILRMMGMLIKKKGIYRMTTKGSYYYHYFEYFYTLSYIDQMWGQMKDNAFPEKMIIK